jgi:hypothetical protein
MWAMPQMTRRAAHAHERTTGRHLYVPGSAGKCPAPGVSSGTSDTHENAQSVEYAAEQYYELIISPVIIREFAGAAEKTSKWEKKDTFGL